ncbi:MAG: OmpH family outer membrane protein [Prevotella sp.]|nr:OmpH family outer membrane protein [Prevotella sp.]
MKKRILSILLLMCPVVMMAQEDSLQVSGSLFGCFSYSQVFHSMPDYAIAKANLEQLTRQYEEETKRSEDEFNKKYEDFLDGQRDFAPSILKKRQSELQDMMERNVAFKKEAQRLLKQAEEDAYIPIKEKINAAVRKLGKERGYIFVLNTDNDNIPYVDVDLGVDITEELIRILKAR